MRRYLLLMGLLVMLWGTDAMAVTIGFDNLPGNNGDFFFNPYTEGIYTVSPGGGASHIGGTLGDQDRHIDAVENEMEIELEREIHDVEREFQVEGLDLRSNGQPGSATTFSIVGVHGANLEIFHFQYTVHTANTFESVRLSSIPDTSNVTRSRLGFGDEVQRLLISGVPGFGVTSFSIDNICLDTTSCSFNSPPPPSDPNGTRDPNSVPEPASLMLLGAGLAGIWIWKRKATKIEKGV